MIKNKPSMTATMTTIIRATDGVDQFAKYFIPNIFRLLSHFSKFKKILQTKLPENTYNNIVTRTKFIDQIICQNNFDQIVILGAGFDSRFLRFNSNKIKFFEVDHPDTQKHKIEILKSKHLLKDNSNIFFVSANLNHRKINQKLLSKNFSSTQKTLFILEGLTMYLSPSSIDQIFKSIKELSPKSEIVFDYINQSTIKNKNSEAIKTVNNLNEKWTFGISKKNLFLQKYHLHLISQKSLSNGSIIHTKF